LESLFGGLRPIIEARSNRALLTSGKVLPCRRLATEEPPYGRKSDSTSEGERCQIRPRSLMEPVIGMGIARLLPIAEISAELNRSDSAYSPSGTYDRIIATFENPVESSICTDRFGRPIILSYKNSDWGLATRVRRVKQCREPGYRLCRNSLMSSNRSLHSCLGKTELHASSGRPQDDDLSKASVAAVLEETVELRQPGCVPLT
jgi:hypothetical protein